MKTYLTVWFNSEGAPPSEISKRLQAMGFRPIQGYHDHVYDWKRKITIDDILQLSDALHETLRGLSVTYKLETI